MNFSMMLLSALISFLVCKTHKKVTLKKVLSPIKKAVSKTKKEWDDIEVK